MSFETGIRAHGNRIRTRSLGISRKRRFQLSIILAEGLFALNSSDKSAILAVASSLDNCYLCPLEWEFGLPITILLMRNMDHPAAVPVGVPEYTFEAVDAATFETLRAVAEQEGQLELLSCFSNVILAQCFEVIGSDPKQLLIVLQGCKAAVDEVRVWESKMCLSHFKERLKAGHYVVSGLDRRGSTITWIRLGEMHHSFGGLARYQTGSQRYYAAMRSYFWYVDIAYAIAYREAYEYRSSLRARYS
jgi:hypothetical protein